MAANEVLRFVVSRPAQTGRDKLRTPATARVYLDGESALVRQVRAAPNRSGGRKILRDWLNDSANSVDPSDGIANLVARIRDLWATAQRPAGGALAARIDEAAKAAGVPSWRDNSTTPKFRTLHGLLADRLFAQTLLGGDESRNAYRTIRMFRALRLVWAAALAGNAGLPRADVDRIMRLRPLLPALDERDVDRVTAQLPTSSDVGDTRRRKEQREEARGKVRSAIAAMKDLADRTEREQDRVSGLAPERLSTRLLGTQNPKAETKDQKAPWLQQLPAEVRSIVQPVVGDENGKSVSAAIEEMETHLRQMSTAVVPNPGKMARLRYRFGGAGIGARMLSSSGAPAGLDAPATVPRGVGELGLPRRGDLVIVRQQLARYELGEIAHVENVLQGEGQERSFARNQTSEIALVATSEASTTEERDNQTTERFELSSAMQEAVEDRLKLEAGVSVSASYGPTVGVQANSQFGYEHAQEQSKESASSFAREVSGSAKSKVETRMTEQRTTRTLTEVRELTRHTVDNTGGAGHVRGVYHWVDKVYEMQVVNYGIRDLYDFFVPEPAAFIRHLNGLKLEEPLELPAPMAPTVEEDGEIRPLTPDDLTEDNYADFVAQTGARDVAAPPAFTTIISGVIQCSVEGDKPASAVNSEMVIPDGYRSTEMKFNGAGHRASDDYFWNVEISGRNLVGRNSEGGSNSLGDPIEFLGRQGKVPVAVVSDGYDQLVVTLWIKCQRTAPLLRAWQLSTYNAILAGYQALRAAYDEERSAATADIQAQIGGRAPAANLDLIRNELKRAVITLMTAQRFERFDSMRPPSDSDGYPEIALADARAEGRYVAFVEQAFEWENMTYVLYPYFWGRKAEWTVTSQLDDVDDRFAKFLRAGFARVQLPVRPRSEDLVSFTFDPGNWSGEVWTQPEPPGFERDGTMAIDDEMRSQTGGLDYVQGEGRISIQANDTLVTGIDTAFSEEDVDRELQVDMVTYRVSEFMDSQQVKLEAPGPTQDIVDALYTLGPKLVGPPWELSVPTTLVYLQDGANLNP